LHSPRRCLDQAFSLAGGGTSVHLLPNPMISLMDDNNASVPGWDEVPTFG
jgi:hypothetical protein